MAVARQGQGNTMLYTVITFVGLFVVVTILAVILYLKSEDWRDQYLASRQELNELASQDQLRDIGSLVGQKDRGQSRLGQLVEYIDQMYLMLVGISPQETSAEVKITEIQTKYRDILAKLPKDMTLSPDANGVGALKVMEIYDNKLKQKQELAEQLTSQLDDLRNEYDLAKKGAMKREEELRTQARSEQERADGVQQGYNQLQELMNKKATEQVQVLMQQRDEAVEEKNKTRQELLAAMSKLSITQNRLEDAMSRLDVLKPRPKEDIAAYQPDGHIVSVENSTNIVFIDIGGNEKVYPGLTFSVYDRNAPIPTDGTSKAEIEVFDVDKNTATARINKSDKKNPIAEGDVIINLIWDSKAANRFVVAGDFDFDGDGNIDSDGATKIKQLIENWGGKLEEVVTIDTDFVVLGASPRVLPKPTLDQIEADPMATDKHEASIKASEQYEEVKNQAKDLYIPVFGVKRFLSFIGYESIASGAKGRAY